MSSTSLTLSLSLLSPFTLSLVPLSFFFLLPSLEYGTAFSSVSLSSLLLSVLSIAPFSLLLSLFPVFHSPFFAMSFPVPFRLFLPPLPFLSLFSIIDLPLILLHPSLPIFHPLSFAAFLSAFPNSVTLSLPPLPLPLPLRTFSTKTKKYIKIIKVKQMNSFEHQVTTAPNEPVVDDHLHQNVQLGAENGSSSSSSAPAAHCAGAKGVNLWLICPFLCQVPSASSPEGSSVRCLECGESEQQFNDLGSTYNHLKKHHPQQFQQLYKQWKSEPPPKRRPYAHRQQQQNANREEGDRAPAVSVNIELKEKAFVDPSTLFSVDEHQQQMYSENDPSLSVVPLCQSAVWCVGLFQRHHFRNGTTGALCLECGNVTWELDTDTHLMDHIVNKHPEYMPNLTTPNMAPPQTGQQISPAYVDEQGELWQCLDIATNGESAEEMFHRHGACPLQQTMGGQQQQMPNNEKFLLVCGVDGASRLCCFRAIWIDHQRAIFQSLGHNHPLITVETPHKMQSDEPSSSSAESVMETIERVLQQDHSTYVDGAGKEWQWLADVFASGGEAELRRVCRANDLYREGGARNFSCKWSSRNARSLFNCPLRGLYVPERNALFHRQNHNHPMPLTAGKSEQIVPPNNIFVDRKGKQWQMLSEIPNKTDLPRVCRANGLVQNGPRNVPGKAYFGCQRAKSGRVTNAAGGTLCPYRALYVAKRKALFHRLEHNHEQKKKF